MYFYSILILIVGVCTAFSLADSNDIHHLCGSKITLNCVIKYFGANGKCRKVCKPKTSAVYDAALPIYIPVINMTAVTSKVYISNLNGRFEEFYKDRKTGNIVISVRLNDISVYAHFSVAINDLGSEPVRFKDHMNATLSEVITAVIPAENGITADSLRNATYNAYFPNSSAAKLIVGPKFSRSDDPVIQASYKAFIADESKAILEIVRTAASFDFLAYLQNNVCDFGISPVIYNDDLSAIAAKVNTDEDRITDPCADGDDYESCAIKFFEKNGCCSVPNKKKPVFRKSFNTYVPSINSIVVLNGARIQGLDGCIQDFYINEATGYLVMIVGFDAYTTNTTEAVLLINQKGREPFKLADHSVASYAVTVTALIPLKNGLTAEAIRKSFVTADLSTFSVDLGPKFTTSNDCKVRKILQNVAQDPVLIGKELFVTEARSAFLAYLQKNICDYNIPISED